MFVCVFFFFFFKQKTAYEIVSRDWSSDVCSSDLFQQGLEGLHSTPIPLCLDHVEMHYHFLYYANFCRLSKMLSSYVKCTKCLL